MLEETLDRGFSCPQSGFDRSVLEFVVTDHTQQVIERFVDLRGDELDDRAPGVVKLLTKWLSSDATFDVVWDVAFGDLYAALYSGTSDLAADAAGVSLRLSACGVAGEWEARFEQPVRLRLGRWLLPRAESVRIAANSSTLTGSLRVGGAWTTISYDSREHAWTTSHITELPVVGVGGAKLAVLSADALSPACAKRLLTADAYEFDPTEAIGGDGWAPSCQTALALIARASDDYRQWVETILRAVVPLRARAGTLNSGSERFSPGIICISNQQHTWLLAEMLVHEATHQYLHVISRLGALDDGSDPNLYYSPFRDKDRPMLFILVAYHAFGNVLLFYRSARERGLVPDGLPADDVFADREGTLERQLRQIEPALENATSLTPLGRALWEPLYTQIHFSGAR